MKFYYVLFFQDLTLSCVRNSYLIFSEFTFVLPTNACLKLPARYLSHVISATVLYCKLLYCTAVYFTVLAKVDRVPVVGVVYNPFLRSFHSGVRHRRTTQRHILVAHV